MFTQKKTPQKDIKKNTLFIHFLSDLQEERQGALKGFLYTCLRNLKYPLPPNRELLWELWELA